MPMPRKPMQRRSPARATSARVLVEFDFAPFAETARLLYEGPWVAERWSVIEDLARRMPDAIHPITRAVVEPGASRSAVETFRAFYRLAELRAKTQPVWNDIDAMLLPTAPSVYTRAQMEADNIRLNSRLGIYTNFVNLLDLCGLAVPTLITADRKPYGVTLLAPSGRDGFLAGLGCGVGSRGGFAAWAPGEMPSRGKRRCI